MIYYRLRDAKYVSLSISTTGGFIMNEETNSTPDLKFFEGEQEETLEQAVAELTPDTIARMEQYEGWIEEFREALQKTIYNESLKSNEKRDISLPLEAVIRVFGATAKQLDNQIDPATQDAHDDLREHMAATISQSLSEFMGKQSIPVYQQDIFMAFTYVLMSYLTQQREHVLSNPTLYTERGLSDEAQVQPE